jgi:predicted dinucleotide-binding enzyme
MNYAIIGSGAIGSALARRFADAGIKVDIANTRGPDSLAKLAADLNNSISPVPLEKALLADVVILAVPFVAVKEATNAVADWKGRITVDATNAIDFSNFTPADLGGRLSTDIVASYLSGAKVVKAFNTLPAAVLASEPKLSDARRVLFLSSNDQQAATTVEGLIANLGFAPINLGKLNEGGRLQQFGGPLMVHSLMKQK